MTKRQKKSSRQAMMARRGRGYERQRAATVAREVADKLTGIKMLQMVPNRAKKRGDRAWNRGETGRTRRMAAKESRRRRLQRVRQIIKAWRHALRKRLRAEVRAHMRKSVR